MFEKRNWKIYFEWIDGKNYNELADEFGLAHSTIKEICHSHLLPKVKGNLWQSQNAYKRFRDWYKAKRLETIPTTATAPAKGEQETQLFK